MTRPARPAPLPEHPPTAPPPSAVDPALAARAAALRTRNPTASRTHPSQGARTVALAASVASTVTVAFALTIADRPESTTSAVAAGAISSARATSGTSGTTNATTATTTRAAARYADGAFTGTAQYTKWGYVQVRATIVGGKLTDVVAVQTPTDRKSANINAQAQPILESQAIARQDADLDVVSGATYTSRTYTASLQAALDAAAAAAHRAGVRTS